MGISFKVSKVGSRFRPKHFQSENIVDKNDADNSISEESSRVLMANESSFTINTRKTEAYVAAVGDNVAGNSCSNGSSISSGGENEVSFTLNLFHDGYCIKKPSEIDVVFHSSTEDGLFLRPYDRVSEFLFSAIESGRLPRDIFDDISCKYVDGGIICEVRDYRKCMSKPGSTDIPVGAHPIVNKVMLKMSLENIVNDIPSISDTSWTYGHLMEAESRILKALQPRLCLEPTPMLGLLSPDTKSEKINLGLHSRRKRLSCMTDVTVTSGNMLNGKKICIDRVQESYEPEGFSSLHGQENSPVTGGIHSVLATREKQSEENSSFSTFQPHQLKVQSGVGNSAPERVGAPLLGKECIASYTGNMNSSASLIRGKMGNLDGDLSSPSCFSRVKPISSGPDAGLPRQQYPDTQSDGFDGSEWKHAVLQQQQIGRGFQQVNPCIQKFSYPMFDGRLGQEHGSTFSAGQQGIKEPIDVDKLDLPEMNVRKNHFNVVDADQNRLDLQQARFLLQKSQQQQAFMSSGYSSIPWNFPNQQYNEKDTKKEDQFPKRKTVQSSRVISGTLVQSPLSSKSGELSSGSLGPHFGAVTTASTVFSQKEKSAVSSGYVAGTPSLTSGANDSLQRQQQAHLAGKRKSNSLPRTPSAGGVGSPASVGNISLPMNVSSPPCGGAPHSSDQSMLERFTKIEAVMTRYQLNRKKNRGNSYPPRNPTMFCGVQVSQCLSALNNSDDGKDDACNKSLSKSVIGGSMNVSKMRLLNFMQADRILQGNVVSVKIQSRMIMIEKTSDGTVAMHCGDAELGDVLAIEDCLPALPNTHLADLLTDQFRSLMVRDGHIVEDHIQPKPTHVNLSSYSQASESNPFTRPVTAEFPHHAGHPSNAPGGSGNPYIGQPHSALPATRTFASGNPSFYTGHGPMPDISMAATRTQLFDQQPPLQVQKNQPSLTQQQHSQLTRSQLMLMNGPLSHMNTMSQSPNLPLGGQVMNKPSQFQLQMLQQQQQPHMQRKLMMGNSLIGAGGMGNNIGMSGVRGMGTGISGPVIPMTSATTVGSNTMNLNQASITQQLRSGQLTQAQAAHMISRMRLAQSRGTLPGNCQTNFPPMVGVRQMIPGSSGLPVLGPNVNRGNLNYMSRATLGNMGPPKLMTGANIYMTQQQQQQLQLQQFQQQMQQQQQLQQFQLQQQQLLQHETTLNAVVSPSQIGSPSAMVVAHQHPSPHQRTPMSPQMSGGGIHPCNPEGCPSSPQLSSQTLGSVSSITNSPMELQGVNMSNSVSNNNG